jgi:hypothetical protein
MYKNNKLKIIHELSNELSNELGNDINNNRSNNIMIPLSPLSHNSLTYKNDYTEYSLKQNFFDPSKSSPPNEFLLKLQLRMTNYSKLCKKDEMRNSE